MCGSYKVCKKGQDEVGEWTTIESQTWSETNPHVNKKENGC